MNFTRQAIDTGIPAEATRGQGRALRARRLAIRVLYGLLSLWTLTMAMGLGILLAGKVPAGPYAFAVAGTTAWKLLSLGGYLVIMWTAGRSVVAVQWVLVGQVTWLIAEVMAPQDPTEGVLAVVIRYAVNTLVFLGPWFLLAPERRQVVLLRARPDRVAVAILALALPVMIVWAQHNAGLQIPTIAGNSGEELRFDVTGLALVFATVGMFAALRPWGRRWPLGVVAAGAVYIGIDSLATPATDLASPGLPGGAAFLALAALLAWRAHQPVPAQEASPWTPPRASSAAESPAAASTTHGESERPGID